MLGERIVFMSINIAGEEERSAAWTQKTIASGEGLFLGKMKEKN